MKHELSVIHRKISDTRKAGLLRTGWKPAKRKSHQKLKLLRASESNVGLIVRPAAEAKFRMKGEIRNRPLDYGVDEIGWCLSPIPGSCTLVVTFDSGSHVMAAKFTHCGHKLSDNDSDSAVGSY